MRVFDSECITFSWAAALKRWPGPECWTVKTPAAGIFVFQLSWLSYLYKLAQFCLSVCLSVCLSACLSVCMSGC